MSAVKLSKAKSLIIRDKRIIIHYPFKLIRKEYLLDSIDCYSKKINKNDSGNGPGYIDFPFLVLELRFKDNHHLIINSKDNTNIKSILTILEKKVPA